MIPWHGPCWVARPDSSSSRLTCSIPASSCPGLIAQQHCMAVQTTLPSIFLTLSRLFAGARRGVKTASESAAVKAAPLKRFFNPAKSGVETSAESCWLSA